MTKKNETLERLDKIKEDMNTEKRIPSRREKPSRRKRVPLGQFQSRLKVPEGLVPPDKVARWVMDHPGRIYQAEEGGYSFVTGSNGEKIKVVGSPSDSGQPIYQYLMSIDREWYEEDQELKQSEGPDRVEEAINLGAVGEQPGERRYVPEDGIKIETKLE